MTTFLNVQGDPHDDKTTLADRTEVWMKSIKTKGFYLLPCPKGL